MKLTQVLLLALALLALPGCSTGNLEQYAGREPALVMPEYFDGRLTAHGVLRDRGGDVSRTFTAELHGSWNNDGVGTLAELFVFSDGEVQERTWTFRPRPDGSYDATAGDVVGTGRISTEGNAMHLDYTLTVRYKGRDMDIAVDDWMWRIDEETVINHSVLKKWGFKVGTLQLSITRRDTPCPANCPR